MGIGTEFHRFLRKRKMTLSKIVYRILKRKINKKGTEAKLI